MGHSFLIPALKELQSNKMERLWVFKRLCGAEWPIRLHWLIYYTRDKRLSQLSPRNPQSLCCYLPN